MSFNELVQGFFKDGFVAGDFTYGTLHIVSLVILILVTVLLPILMRKKTTDQVFKLAKWLAWAALIIYISRRLNGIFQGGKILNNLWPFYLCNVVTIGLSVLIICNVRKNLDFFLLMGLIGGIITFAIPQGIFNDKYLTLAILDSITSHYVIIFIPVLLLFTKQSQLRFKRIWQIFAGLSLALVNAEIVQRMFFGNAEYTDYLYLHSDIPFVIEGVPQFLIMSTLLILAVTLVYCISEFALTFSARKSRVLQISK